MGLKKVSVSVQRESWGSKKYSEISMNPWTLRFREMWNNGARLQKKEV